MTNRDLLLALKRQIEDHYRQRLQAVNLILETIAEIEKPPKAHLQAVSDLNKRQRVRGVLTAVKGLIPELPEVFDRNDVFKKLKEKNPDLAARVSLENLRSTLRSLAKGRLIELRKEATSTTPARYGVRADHPRSERSLALS
jgi:hypothetical protein